MPGTLGVIGQAALRGGGCPLETLPFRAEIPHQERRIELNTTEHVRTYLEQLVYTGMYGKSAGDAAALLVVRALNRLLRRGELTRLPPLHPIEPKEPSGDDGG